MKAKEIKYINTDNREEMEAALQEAFGNACEARDKAQLAASQILHIKNSIGATEHEKLRARVEAREKAQGAI